jgi:hypothetical protein
MGEHSNSGAKLLVEWRIPAIQARYHQDGTFYMPLERFPAALCDPNGYLLFQSYDDYRDCQYLEIGQRINAHRGISTIPGYVRVR